MQGWAVIITLDRIHFPFEWNNRMWIGFERRPLVIQATKDHVRARTAPGDSEDEALAVIHEPQADDAWKHDYNLSEALIETPLAAFTCVSKAAHRIEECFERTKGKRGLAHYELRTWRVWDHQTLSLSAPQFFTQ